MIIKPNNAVIKGVLILLQLLKFKGGRGGSNPPKMIVEEERKYAYHFD
jgi:hypothetical protein